MINRDDFHEAIEYIRSLETGWCGGQSEPFDSVNLDWLKNFIHAAHEENVPFPLTWPSPFGEVNIQWNFGEWVVAATIKLSIRNIYICVTNDRFDETLKAKNIRCAHPLKPFVTFVKRFMPTKLEVAQDLCVDALCEYVDMERKLLTLRDSEITVSDNLLFASVNEEVEGIANKAAEAVDLIRTLQPGRAIKTGSTKDL